MTTQAFQLDLGDRFTREVLAAGARRSNVMLDWVSKNMPPDLDTMVGLVLVAVTIDAAARSKGVTLPPFGELCAFVHETYGEAQVEAIPVPREAPFVKGGES